MASSHLPLSEADYLRSLYPHSMPCLRARVRALREAGWTLRAIGEPVNAPRSTVRSWENHDDADRPCTLEAALENQPPLPTPPGIRPAPLISTTSAYAPPPRVRAFSLDVPDADQRRIAQLAPLARRVRGGTPASSPYRQAKGDLNDVLSHYYERGVPVQRLAELAGVTYRAMKVRLDEHAAVTATAS